MAIQTKVNKGSLISSLGGLSTIIGMTLLSMDSNKVAYLSFTLLGVVLGAYGLFVMVKFRKEEKK